jgi:hypothetical protein
MFKGFGKTQTGTKTGSAPGSNTGLNSQELQGTALYVRPDWVQGTIRFRALEDLHQCREFIEGFLKDLFVLHPDRGRFVGKQFNNTALGIEGCLILYNMPDQEPDDLGHAFISLPAAALATVEVRDIWRMLSGLVGVWGFKATRFDIAIDDFAKTITYEQIQSALANRNFTGFRKSTARKNYDLKQDNVGFTCTFGSRQSNRYYRFYDKEQESGGKIKSNRLEVELKEELAVAAIAEWLELSPENFEDLSPRLLAGLVVGGISFVGRTKDKNVSRMSMLPWWKQFVEKVGCSIRHTVSPVQTNLERKKEWFTRQVAPTVALFRKVMGMKEFKQFLASELEAAEERFTAFHETFVQLYRQDRQISFEW